MSNLIYTNDKCTGCNKCIRSCPTIAANHVTSGRVIVDNDACIACGECLQVCRHDAREFNDDSEEFFNSLKQ